MLLVADKIVRVSYRRVFPSTIRSHLVFRHVMAEKPGHKVALYFLPIKGVKGFPELLQPHLKLVLTPLDRLP